MLLVPKSSRPTQWSPSWISISFGLSLADDPRSQHPRPDSNFITNPRRQRCKLHHHISIISVWPFVNMGRSLVYPKLAYNTVHRYKHHGKVSDLSSKCCTLHIGNPEDLTLLSSSCKLRTIFKTFTRSSIRQRSSMSPSTRTIQQQGLTQPSYPWLVRWDLLRTRVRI